MGIARETRERACERDLHQMDVLVWEVMRLREELDALKVKTPDREAAPVLEPPRTR